MVKSILKHLNCVVMQTRGFMVQLTKIINAKCYCNFKRQLRVLNKYFSKERLKSKQ